MYMTVYNITHVAESELNQPDAKNTRMNHQIYLCKIFN
jgi:hypothetical protein